jgi:hypothetical protein
LENDFSIFLHQEKNVNDCAGWFDSRKREFIVAMQGKGGFSTLIHEYSHFLQWRDRKKYYNRLLKSCDIVFSWIAGKFYKKDVVEEAIKYVIELEWDCEMGALELIKKYDLDVDIKKYIQSANAYIMFYHVIHNTRKWCKKSPYNPEITRSMPECLQPLEYYQILDNIKDHQWEKYLKVLT